MKVQVFTYHGHQYVSHPRLNLTNCPGEYVNSSAFRDGGALLRMVQFSRLGAYRGGRA